ncbi:MAG: alpha/beta fold hydrolase [Bacteroidetes bacterium]|nr:MAG: alpha/beta fold hydrolase [Bacteroidota bacterium]
MNVSTKTLTHQDYEIHLMTYLPSSLPKAVIQINHGLAEHSERYKEFCQFLCDKGYAVYIHDHPGHGKSLNNDDKHGHLPWYGGWDLMLDVIHAINKNIRKKHPQVPVFLMGHSMGSLLSRYYNAAFPMYFKGMILSGTTEPDTSKLRSTLFLVRINKIFRNTRHINKDLNNYFYKNYNRTIKNPRTDFDWLSSDEKEVDKYINDPLCGFHLSLGFFKNLSQGTLQMLKTEKKLRFRKNFSTLIISGKNDPVGRYGKDPQLLYNKYIQQGFYRTNIALLDGRHELLNERETIRKQTYQVISNFIEDKLLGSA